MNQHLLRAATTDDAEHVARIYNHYVLNTTVTFDTEPKTTDERRTWIAERSDAHPVVVVEDSEGAVRGWGALSRHSDRPAWAHTVEMAIYVEHGHTGRGLGSAIMRELVRRAREAGHHVIVSRIVAGNVASLRSVERAGFERVGTMREVGRKFGKWLDVVILQLMVDPMECTREPHGTVSADAGL